MNTQNKYIQFIIALLLLLSTGVACNLVESEPLPSNEVVVQATVGSMTTNLPIIEGRRTGSAYLYNFTIIENDTDWSPTVDMADTKRLFIIVEPKYQSQYISKWGEEAYIVLSQDYRRPDTLYFKQYQ